MKPDSFWENGVALPFNDARYSGLSAGVPGTVAKWDLALKRYGSKPLRKLLEPGIEVASKGFTVDQTFVDQTVPNVDYFNDVPSTAALYLDPDGTPRDVGSTLKQPGPREDLRVHRALRRRRVLPRPAGEGDRRRRADARRSRRPPTTSGGPA